LDDLRLAGDQLDAVAVPDLKLFQSVLGRGRGGPILELAASAKGADDFCHLRIGGDRGVRVRILREQDGSGQEKAKEKAHDGG